MSALASALVLASALASALASVSALVVMVPGISNEYQFLFEQCLHLLLTWLTTIMFPFWSGGMIRFMSLAVGNVILTLHTFIFIIVV